MLAHAPDLPVQTLRQDDPERVLGHGLDPARVRDRVEDRYARRHSAQELRRERPVDGYDVFLLVLVLRSQDRVDDVAVIGQEDQAFRVLVQPADGEQPLRMADEIDDVVLYGTVGRALDADGLVEREVDPARFSGDRPAVDLDLIAIENLGTERRDGAVYLDTARGNPGIGLAPRADAGLADELVEAQAGRTRQPPARRAR